MRRQRSGAWGYGALALGGVLAIIICFESAAAAREVLPPSPYVILGLDLADPPALDSAALCVPTDDERIAPALDLLDKQGVAAALLALAERSDAAGSELAGELVVLKASLAARRSPTPADAASDLRAAAEGAPTLRSRACAWLELARLQLISARFAEARASARRALRGDDAASLPASIRRAADHYRAESLYRSGRVDEARELFQALAGGMTPVARSARLRLADLDFVAEPTRERRLRVEAAIEEAGISVTSRGAWAARIAEWALRAGEIDEALVWLGRVPGALSSREKVAVSIRRADALHLLDRSDEAAAALRRLTDGAVSEPLRRLAVVRMLDLDLDNRLNDEAIGQLERAAASGERGVELYARSVLADRLMEEGEKMRSLDVLVGLAFERAPEEITGRLRDGIDRVLAVLADERDCAGLLADMGGRRSLLLEHAGAPAPFLRLGDCYLEYEMPRSALEVYRGVTRAFGPELAKEITLRSALAEARSGEVDSARAAARSNVNLGRPPKRAWRLLYGEILMEDDRPDAALTVFMPLVREVADGAFEGPEAIRALWHAARAASRDESTPAVEDDLRAGLARVSVDSVAGTPLGETLVLVADLHRRSGRYDQARWLYGDALGVLEPGPLHSLAAFWSGALARDIDSAREIWGQVTSGEDAWARLVHTEQRLSQTRAALGRSELPSDSLARTGVGGAP